MANASTQIKESDLQDQIAKRVALRLQLQAQTRDLDRQSHALSRQKTDNSNEIRDNAKRLKAALATLHLDDA